MSASYHCNFCGCKMHKNKNSYKQFVWVDKPLHKNKHINAVRVILTIDTCNGNLDICEACVEKVKTEGVKKLKQKKIIN